MLHLTDEALKQYLQFFSWQVYGAVIILTIITSLLGALISFKILKKHFEKAGVI